MSQGKQIQILPKPDGTTSTNYGPQFEISSTAIFVLRSCKLNKQFTVWINYTEYEPWDDIVAEIDGEILCVQLKHNEKLDKNKLNVCLNARETLLNKHSAQRNSIHFVYFATSPDEAIRNTYSALNGNVPYLLKLLITNYSNLYYDAAVKDGATFFCMNQHNVSGENADVKQALADYIGQHYLSEDHLKYIQTHFQEYIRCRYLRLIKGSDPLTNYEVHRYLAYAMLQKFKIEYRPSSFKIKASNNLEVVMETSSVVVVNHRWSSSFREQIWCHLLAYYEQRINRKHLKQANLDELWLEGKIHMPVESPTKDTDRIILRALEIGNFEPKVVILRPKIFRIRDGQDFVTLLENLEPFDPTHRALKVKTGDADDSQELFKLAQVDLKGLVTGNRNVKLHQDAFSRSYKDFFKGSDNSLLGNLVEAHDEFHYVNDYNLFGNTRVPALFAALKIKQVGLKIIETLIRLGADLNSSIEGGFKPIFYAVEENRSDLVELLLKNGANPNLADREGMTVLFNACIKNKVEIASLLIKYGADRNAGDFDGVRPLFMAYNNRNFEILRLLLKNFDKAAAANVQGSHILHKIAEDGSIEGLRCILDVCTDVRIFMTGDVFGRTPLEIALLNKNQEFAQLLKQALN